ncbi:MAG: putative lipid II flippase FtsW [Deltaproteobacteria bacterium]|nr:putative lipid II flippase FtsW [Deltaproteobacteria bacterium]
MNRKIPFDYWLLLITFALVLVGIVMVYSASSIYALQKYQDSYFFLYRQGIYAAIGFVLLTVLLFTDYHSLYRVIYPFLGLSLLLMLVTYIPGLGHKVAGAQRWISLFGFKFQPSEMAKYALIFYLSYSLSKKEGNVKSFIIGFLPHLLVSGVFLMLLLGQPDFGTVIVISYLVFLMLFVAGARLSYIASAILISAPVIWFLIASKPYRQKRILAFLNPWDDPANTGFQIIQSFLAFYSGKIWGRGLGDGMQKLFYLPEAHTDFIFSVIGEELGFLGIGGLLFLFLIFMYRGIRIAVKAPDLFGTYLAFGITTLISFQALINIAVVMGLLPTKGLALPFLSYGGTSLVANLAAVGILLNISAQQQEISWRAYR